MTALQEHFDRSITFATACPTFASFLASFVLLVKGKTYFKNEKKNS
jgi:hypothetical protein